VDGTVRGTWFPPLSRKEGESTWEGGGGNGAPGTKAESIFFCFKRRVEVKGLWEMSHIPWNRCDAASITRGVVKPFQSKKPRRSPLNFRVPGGTERKKNTLDKWNLIKSDPLLHVERPGRANLTEKKKRWGKKPIT